MSCFVSGLKQEIRTDVQLFNPQSMAGSTGLARENKVPNFGRSTKMEERRGSISAGFSSAKLVLPPIKRLTPLEIKEKRDKGLCYNCDKKFAPGRQCKTKKLFLVEGSWPDLEDDAQPVDDCMEVERRTT